MFLKSNEKIAQKFSFRVKSPGDLRFSKTQYLLVFKISVYPYNEFFRLKKSILFFAREENITSTEIFTIFAIILKRFLAIFVKFANILISNDITE